MASDKVKLTIHSPKLQESEVAVQKVHKNRFIRTSKKRSFQDKLLRNSCFACATLLGILALGNVQQPWARNTSAAVKKALTMEIDLDKSLGQLKFVQKMMPESALVFFNLNGENELSVPVSGELIHSYSDSQPWLMFSCPQNTEVYAAADGTVAAVSPMHGGGYGILIDHGSGLESVYACLSSADVQPGAAVVRGSIIGKAEGDLYFELRQGGVSINPEEKMGL